MKLGAISDTVLSLYAHGLAVRAICAATGIKAPRTVQRVLDRAREAGDPRAIRRRHPPRPRAGRAFLVVLPVAAHGEVSAAATRRGIDESELCCQLIERIAGDGLIDAILDDEDEGPQMRAAREDARFQRAVRAAQAAPAL